MCWLFELSERETLDRRFLGFPSFLFPLFQSHVFFSLPQFGKEWGVRHTVEILVQTTSWKTYKQGVLFCKNLSFPFHDRSKERIFGKCKEENMNFFQWLGILIDFAFCQQITGVFIACYRFVCLFWNKK